MLDILKNHIPNQIKNMRNLYFLCLNGTRASTLRPLLKCKKLRILRMYKCDDIYGHEFSKMTITTLCVDAHFI